jgi:TPR repeat protein
LEKKLEMVTEENAKLKQLAKSQVENIIEPAAKKGDVGAIQVVGECYEYGLGGKREDEKQAIEYYEKGVSANSPASQCFLGLLLVEQENDVKAKERGVELLKKSAAAEFPLAQHRLALYQWDGEIVQEDEKSAVELWTQAAKNGFAPSQYELGDCYARRVGGVEKDPKQAKKWYLKAAEADEGRAQMALGRLYKNDKEMKDLNKSIEWYKKAYYNGSARQAAEALRNVFDPDNKTTVADLDKAIEWSYRERNSHGTAFLIDKRACFPSESIKSLYRSSIHASLRPISLQNLTHLCNRQLKFALFRRAASFGSSYAQFYYSARLPDNNPNKLKYLRMAAEKNSRAQWELGVMYETGRCGLVKNPILAKEWKDKAIANGYKPPQAVKNDRDEDDEDDHVNDYFEFDEEENDL